MFVYENAVHFIERAMLACKNSGFSVDERFVEVSKTLDIPDKSIQVIEREEIKRLRNSKSKLMLDE